MKGGVVQVDSNGQDMTVTLEWGAETKLPESAVVEVRDLHDYLITSRVVQPRPGEKRQVTFEAVLSDFESHGLVYRIEVSEGLTDPYEVRVALDCPAGPDQECSYRLTENMSSEALVVDAKLEAALQNTSPTSLDILGDILKAAPDLVGQVATLALQLKDLDKRFGIPTDNCVCFWQTRETGRATTEVLTEPSSYQGLFEVDSSTNSRARSEQNGEFNLLTSGQIKLSVKMACGRFKSWSTGMPMLLPGSTSALVPMPVLEGCTNVPCTAKVHHSLRFEGRLKARADVSRGTPPEINPEVLVSESLFYQVDGEPASTFHDRLSVQTPSDVLASECHSSTEVTPAPSEATLDVLSEIELTSSEEPEYCTLAEGMFSAIYTMSAVAEATCGIPTVAGVRVPRNQLNRRTIGSESAGIFREPYCE